MWNTEGSVTYLWAELWVTVWGVAQVLEYFIFLLQIGLITLQLSL